MLINSIDPNLQDLATIYSTLSVNSTSQIIFTIIFLIFWSILYTVVNHVCNFKSLSPKDSDDVKNRIVSIVHGVASFWFATYEYLPYPVFKYPFAIIVVSPIPIFRLLLYFFRWHIAFMTCLRVCITDSLTFRLFHITYSVFWDSGSEHGRDMVQLMESEDYL